MDGKYICQMCRKTTYFPNSVGWVTVRISDGVIDGLSGWHLKGNICPECYKKVRKALKIV